ncbi:MAG: HtaA domain-containing protein [Solirubrobacterales bacterium]|nr:HtaA domain-containing protein [Solirubrobacterales bacterium]
MSSSFVARRGFPAALTVLAAAVLFLVGLHPGSARAAEVNEGSVVITISSGKAGRVGAISPAKVVKRIGKKGAKVKSAAKGGTFGESVASGLQSAGGLKLRNGKRSLKITGLKLSIDKKLAVVRGNALGKKNIVIFTAAGKGTLGSDPSSVKFTNGKLKLQKSVANKIRKRLKLKKAPTAKLGTLYVSARSEPVVDQYYEQCGVEVDSQVDNSWPDAGALPTLSGGVAATASGGIDWGLKSSFRGYVYGTMVTAGKGDQALQALDGASRSSLPSPFDPTRGFNFPVGSGEYAANEGGITSDDQAIINGSGTGLICNNEHHFWVSISDPTVVIDGTDSRIVATISQNMNGGGIMGPVGPWQTPQRVDLADLDLTGVTPTYGTGTVTWSDIPVTLSSDAAPFATYAAGQSLDPITVSLETE